MTLEEQVRPHAQYWDSYNDEPLKYNHTGKLLKIINEFAIGFAEWVEYSCWKIDSDRYLYEDDQFTTKELLLIYKKEKGL
jgi:hypothetical protein